MVTVVKQGPPIHKDYTEGKSRDLPDPVAFVFPSSYQLLRNVHKSMFYHTSVAISPAPLTTNAHLVTPNQRDTDKRWFMVCCGWNSWQTHHLCICSSISTDTVHLLLKSCPNLSVGFVINPLLLDSSILILVMIGWFSEKCALDFLFRNLHRRVWQVFLNYSCYPRSNG